MKLKGTQMTFDEERSAFFIAFGEALDAWTSVEDHLYLIFLGCVSPADYRVAAAIYYATEGSRIKLNITDAAIKMALEGRSELAEWEKLYIDVREKSGKRNELAHHEVLADQKRAEGKRFLLIDSLLNPLRKRKGKFLAPEGLGIKELKECRKVFTALTLRLGCFHLSCAKSGPYGEGGGYYIEPRGFLPVKHQP
jgi:hypothetical protein